VNNFKLLDSGASDHSRVPTPNQPGMLGAIRGCVWLPRSMGIEENFHWRRPRGWLR
jgi:hypothetical protein